MDEPQQGPSGQPQQQQLSGRAEDDAEQQSGGPIPAAVATTAAAAEDPTPATAAAGQNDPRKFQNPQPDDATTASGAAATTGRSKTAKTKGGKAASKGGGKGDADGEPCSNCGTLGVSRKCSQCRQTQYCGQACFKEHWKYGGHKKACAAYILAAAAQAQQDRLCKGAAEAEQCLICLEPPLEPTRLPCGHAFCTACVVELRAKGVSDACPLCRSPLPPGPEKLFELAYRVWAKLHRVAWVVRAGDGRWRELSASQQGEMDGAIVMMQEAMDQGHIIAAESVGCIYHWGQGVAIDEPRAMAAYKVGAEGGHSTCQWQVGFMYTEGLGVDVDYAQALPWLEKAAAQDKPEAVGELGSMYFMGDGVTPSWRRAREYYKRAIELGNPRVMMGMQILTESVQKVAPLMDKRVELHGTSRADMNGKRGVATDFHPMGGSGGDQSTWRYTVQLDGGEAFRLKRVNVRAEGTVGRKQGRGKVR